MMKVLSAWAPASAFSWNGAPTTYVYYGFKDFWLFYTMKVTWTSQTFVLVISARDSLGKMGTAFSNLTWCILFICNIFCKKMSRLTWLNLMFFQQKLNHCNCWEKIMLTWLNLSLANPPATNAVVRPAAPANIFAVDCIASLKRNCWNTLWDGI